MKHEIYMLQEYLSSSYLWIIFSACREVRLNGSRFRVVVSLNELPFQVDSRVSRHKSTPCTEREKKLVLTCLFMASELSPPALAGESQEKRFTLLTCKIKKQTDPHAGSRCWFG